MSAPSSPLPRAGLIGPTTFLYAALLVVPLLLLAAESFRPYVGGRIGGTSGWTVKNYADFLHVEYARSFRETVLLSLYASAAGLLLAFPLAHLIARTRSRMVRRVWINVLVAALFLDLLIRSYALALMFGPTGIGPLVAEYFGIFGNDVSYVRGQVLLGLMYFVIPLSTLTLVGPIENINPKLCEAALTLGAPRWKSVLVTDVALSVPAILSSFLISFSLCVSAFTVPLILGKGFVVFVANLIYERFADIANFPSGAALSVLLLVLSLAVVYAISRSIRLLTRQA